MSGSQEGGEKREKKDPFDPVASHAKRCGGARTLDHEKQARPRERHAGQKTKKKKLN